MQGITCLPWIFVSCEFGLAVAFKYATIRSDAIETLLQSVARLEHYPLDPQLIADDHIVHLPGYCHWCFLPLLDTGSGAAVDDAKFCPKPANGKAGCGGCGNARARATR